MDEMVFESEPCHYTILKSWILLLQDILVWVNTSDTKKLLAKIETVKKENEYHTDTRMKLVRKPLA
jgi:hypothetical protein